MSQRELVFVLAHAQFCVACRDRLIVSPQAVLTGRMLSAEERETIARLQAADFFTPERLAKVSGVSAGELSEYANHPVVRLRHL
jgi:hypothetical protein